MIIIDGGNNCGNNLSGDNPLMMTLEIFKKLLNLKQTNACKSHNIDRLKWHKSDLNSYYNAA